MIEGQPCVYDLASRRHGTLYIGVTSNLSARLYQHREGLNDGFTKRHRVHRLVSVEMHGAMTDAIQRETQLKASRRDWKIAMIERDNPFWEDRAVMPGFVSVQTLRQMDAGLHRHDGEVQGQK